MDTKARLLRKSLKQSCRKFKEPKMCRWFSCISDGRGRMYYFDEKQRQEIYDGKALACKIGRNPITTRDDLDSHSALADFYGVNCDKVNKYEFRPLDRKFQIDQINTLDDSTEIKRRCQRLNYKKLAPPELILKPLVNPTMLGRKRATANDIILLKKWDSVRASVWGGVRDSVRGSVRDSMGDGVWASVRDSVGDSVGDSVWAGVWNNVWDSAWAYAGSFFNIPKWKYVKHKKGAYPFQPVADLWERGIVTSFDGKVWRLHGHKGAIIKEITKTELQKI